MEGKKHRHLRNDSPPPSLGNSPKLLGCVMALRGVLVAVAAAVSFAGAVPYNQIVALEELFESTDGKAWFDNSNWGIGDPCDVGWFGVWCTSRGGDMCVATFCGLVYNAAL
jgi:hypothetical protein